MQKRTFAAWWMEEEWNDGVLECWNCLATTPVDAVADRVSCESDYDYEYEYDTGDGPTPDVLLL